MLTEQDAQRWVGKHVEQVSCTPGNEKFVGRKGRVEEAILDEKGNIHCKTDDGVWCPAHHLCLKPSVDHIMSGGTYRK